MSWDWRECLSRPSSPAHLAGLDAYVQPDTEGICSPIDSFHETIKKILQAATPEYLILNPITGPPFLGGVVATTEEFLRSLFGRLIAVCPDAQAHAAEKTIHLGSVVWHGRGVVARGAFESMSLTGRKAITKTTKDFLNYEIKKSDRVWGVLDEYDKVCEIRHGAVHSGVTVPGKNAIKLRLSPVMGTPRLNVGFAQLQECADVCTALAVSLNLDLFGVFAERWATSWRDYPAWAARSEQEYFKQIWEIFYCSYDNNRSLIESPASITKCRNAVKKEYP